jgi:phospholipid/cholesterol/gamma-HCH transport system ATP-binding protein
VIEFRNVDFSIGGNPILRDVSFRVPRGKTKVILGPSGSGKSTILRLMLGLYSPDRGEIFVDGEDVTRVSAARLRQIRSRMGMVFQQGALFDSMTVGENVGYALLEAQRDDEREVEEPVRHYLDLVGLDPDLIDRMPDQLSGGMQRRVAIARALAALDPVILLYDEPTTGLDPQSAERITDLIVHLRDSLGKTAIMVTHDIADAFKVADDVTILERGSVVFEGTSAELARTSTPFINEFLAPFRKAIAAAQLQFQAAPRGPSGPSAAPHEGGRA